MGEYVLPLEKAPQPPAASEVAAQSQVPARMQMPHGAMKIAIELEGNRKAPGYIKIYNELVDCISKIVNDNLKGYTGKEREERFITEVWGVMSGNLRIQYGTNAFNFMSEALDSNKFDCSNSAFLVYDIAKKAGVNAEFVWAPGHAFIKTDNFYFETTTGGYHSSSILAILYPLHRVRKADEDLAIAYNLRGIARQISGQLDEAVASYKKGIDKDPRHSELHNNLGNVYLAQGRPSDAMVCFNKAIEVDPKFAQAYDGLGRAHFKDGRLSDAIACFNKAIALNQKFAGAYDGLGEVYLEQGRLSDAMACFNKAITLNPELVSAYRNRAKVDDRLGRKNLAENNREIAERLVDAQVDKYRNRAKFQDKLAKESGRE